jgi:glutamyl/glutaminyl-tRNA synthetase
MVNYLALLGWNPGGEEEIFTREALVAKFDLDHVQKAGAIFDREKLEWMNGVYIRNLSNDELAERLRPYLPALSADVIRRAAPALQERMKTLSEARELLGYLTAAPSPPAFDDDTRAKLRAAIATLRDVEWAKEPIESALEALREREGWSRGKLINPIRLAVVGGNSPPIGDTLALLPKEEALHRIEVAA